MIRRLPLGASSARTSLARRTPPIDWLHAHERASEKAPVIRQRTGRGDGGPSNLKPQA